MTIRLVFAFVIVALAGCQTTPEAPKPVSAPSSAPATAPAPTPAAEPKAPEGPPPGTAAAKSQATQLLRHAAEQLNEGNEEVAREYIAQALVLDPGNRTGTCLMRGLTADPQTAFGRDSTNYTVRQGDTLGSIAQRSLGEGCEFYLLARYNQIRVPSRLYVGQVLKIPGKVALAPLERGAKPAEVTADPAKPAPADAGAAPLSPAKRAQSAADVRAEIERHQRNAIAAFRRQDLATSIKEWERVLELDPNHDLAKARRQEALELERKLKQVK